MYLYLYAKSNDRLAVDLFIPVLRGRVLERAIRHINQIGTQMQSLYYQKGPHKLSHRLTKNTHRSTMHHSVPRGTLTTGTELAGSRGGQDG